MYAALHLSIVIVTTLPALFSNGVFASEHSEDYPYRDINECIVNVLYDYEPQQHYAAKRMSWCHVEYKDHDGTENKLGVLIASECEEREYTTYDWPEYLKIETCWMEDFDERWRRCIPGRNNKEQAGRGSSLGKWVKKAIGGY